MRQIIAAALVSTVAWFFVVSAQAQNAPAAPADKTSRDASKVTFDYNEMPLKQVVADLAEHSGNAPFGIMVRKEILDKPVTLAVKDALYWEAVDKVAALVGVVYAPMWGGGVDGGKLEGHLALRQAHKDAKLTGYSGPVVVKADSVVKEEILREPDSGSASFQRDDKLNPTLTYFWEDRLDPLTEEIELTKVVTSRGGSLLPDDPVDRRKVNNRVMAGTRNPPCATAAFSLPMPAPDARFIAELSGVARLNFATGEREVTIDDVFAAAGKEFKDGDWTIKVTNVRFQKQVQTMPNSVLEVQVEVKYKGKPMEIPTFWTTGSYGWYVQGGEGVKRPRGNAAPMGPKGGGGGGQYAVYFNGDYEAGATSLVVVLPKVFETKEYPFTIKDIPLP